MLKRTSLQRGDTIIEVLLAFTVFSLVAVGTLTIMNQGTQSAQKALEISLVRQQIDAQAEALRFIQSEATSGTQSEYGDTWNRLTTVAPGGLAVTNTAQAALNLDDKGKCPARANNAFILDAHNATIASGDKFIEDGEQNEPPFAHVFYDDAGKLAGATGIWVEAIKPGANSRFVDFAIKTCWFAPGEGPATILGTIVRLYAP